MNRFFLTLGLLLAMEVSAGAQNTGNFSNPQALARSLSKSFADVYERVSPGVVVIEAEADDSLDNIPQGSPLAQFFGRNPNLVPRQPEETNQGSGFIITADGYILTNNHVLEGVSRDVQIILKDGRKLPGKIVGTDPISDLAVIKIEGSNLPAVELGDSDQTRVGEFAFAIGAPYDLRDTFTYGVVSGKGRTEITGSQNYEEYLQTDASINPGNSGGPLVDIDGKVIGVNTLIRDFNRGLGFAIPINIAKKVASQLIADGRAVRPWLGIGITGVEDLAKVAALDPDVALFFRQNPDLPKGILVTAIRPGTPASLSSLRPFDVITSIDGTAVENSRALQKIILEKKIGQEVELQVWRNHRTVKVKLRTAEHTDGFVPVANQRSMPPGSSLAPPAADDDEEDSVAATPAPRSPSAGLMVRTLNADTAIAMNLQAEEGVLVTSVQPGSPAAAAGVQVGDVITSVGSTPVRTKEDFLKAVSSATDENLMLNINRGDEKTYEILKF